MKKVPLFLVILVLCSVGYTGYIYQTTGTLPFQKKGSTAQVVPMAQVVDVVPVARQKIIPEASFVAKIESMEKVGLRARVTGFLQEAMVNEGDIVTKGQPLFQIEKVNFEAQVRQAAANLAKAEAAAVIAKA